MGQSFYPWTISYIVVVSPVSEHIIIVGLVDVPRNSTRYTFAALDEILPQLLIPGNLPEGKHKL